jgi:hypothetical protein
VRDRWRNSLRPPRASASTRVPATRGEVVSNPVAKKTTCISGLSAARASASRGEYTTRTSAPSARASLRDASPPGTRIMSPKVASTTPGVFASAAAVSTSCMEVTHTGQPGPLRSLMPSGRRLRTPWRNMATVWVPQTSMSFNGLPISFASAWMALPSLPGSSLITVPLSAGSLSG